MRALLFSIPWPPGRRWLLGVALGLVMLAPGSQPGTARSAHRPLGYLGRGSWSWFGAPHAVAVKGQYNEIYIGWIDWRGNITIAAYDPQYGVIQEHVIGTLFHDDHSAPSIFVEPDQRLTAFWSAHNGSRMFYRTTVRPQDITAWGPLEHVPANTHGNLGFTYPSPVMLSAEQDELYLFWRGGYWGTAYATRSLSGTWNPARKLIAVKGERPYVKVDSNGVDTIALAFSNGHPRNALTSVYFAEYRAGSLWTAAGRRIASLADAPISPNQADIVYNGGATRVASWVWDVALEGRRPVIVYATFPSNNNHAYWYARWNGRRWVSHFLTFAGPSISPTSIEYEYSGGMALDHSDPSVVYLSRHVADGWEIERWATSNGGYSWRHRVVAPSSGTENVRPVVPSGSSGGPMRLLWLRGDYHSYTRYRTSIAYLR
jgi:hypothetical protein